MCRDCADEAHVPARRNVCTLCSNAIASILQGRNAGERLLVKSTDSYSRIHMGSSARYEIRVQGSIGPEWAERLGGLRCEVIPGEAGRSQTLLVGCLIDQDALSGVLNSLYDLRMPLLSLECIESRTIEEKK